MSPTPHLMNRPRTRIVQSSYDRALQSKVTHRFVPGRGYFEYSAPPLAYRPKPGVEQVCMPKQGARDGSAHFLKPPGAGVPMVFRWVERERAWERAGGKRLAFTAEYLAHFGWRYVAPCLK